jgi:hypothetical protein
MTFGLNECARQRVSLHDCEHMPVRQINVLLCNLPDK